MAGRVLPFFKPPFHAVVRQCNLCGSKIGEDKYETEIARNIEARELSGQYVFCDRCDEFVGEVTEKVAQKEANLDAEFEKVKSEKLRLYSTELMKQFTGKSAREVASIPPRQEESSPPLRSSDSRPSRASSPRKTRAGSIPNPKGS